VTRPGDSSDAFAVTDVNRVRRYHHRGQYDRATIFAILDQGIVAHVAFVVDGRPMVIPMAYGRDGDRLFLHGARKGRISTATVGEPVSIGVTLVDGIVVARSLFESSMNYRAVVIHGRVAVVTGGAERLHALRCIVEHALPGRWSEVRAPSEQQLKATEVLEVEIETASAKVRAGDVVEDVTAEDADVWCGVVPLATVVGAPETDGTVPSVVPVPASVRRLGDRFAVIPSAARKPEF
jgi:nitroimidazol reductase NimA-like FMN-containing flavoprotein (pyridoxamine 5'-phosphate oxidase superfamily)